MLRRGNPFFPFLGGLMGLCGRGCSSGCFVVGNSVFFAGVGLRGVFEYSRFLLV